MSIDDRRLPGAMRGCPPCKNCEERHTACHDHCPKDQRGEYGCQHWKAEAEAVNQKRRTYAADRNNYYEEIKRRAKWGIKTF
jgi:hypothetical protein